MNPLSLFFAGTTAGPSPATPAALTSVVHREGVWHARTLRDEVHVTRSDLRQLLMGFQGEAAGVLLSVLDDPNSELRDDATLRPTPTADLLTIHQRRARHVKAVGLATLGFDESVARIEESSCDELRLAVTIGSSRHPKAIGFLAPER